MVAHGLIISYLQFIPRAGRGGDGTNMLSTRYHSINNYSTILTYKYHPHHPFLPLLVKFKLLDLQSLSSLLFSAEMIKFLSLISIMSINSRVISHLKETRYYTGRILIWYLNLCSIRRPRGEEEHNISKVRSFIKWYQLFLISEFSELGVGTLGDDSAVMMIVIFGLSVVW